MASRKNDDFNGSQRQATMNFWWVNHSQTFRHEFFGKHIWSPKRKRNDQINPFYETLSGVALADNVYRKSKSFQVAPDGKAEGRRLKAEG